MPDISSIQERTEIESSVMTDVALPCRASVATCLALVFPVLMPAGGPAHAAACAFEAQGEGRVATVLDARTFRLDDGREVRLAAIEPALADKAKGVAALSAIVSGREITLHGEDDTPDRYGRQPAHVFVKGSETSVQGELLRRGEALASVLTWPTGTARRPWWRPRGRRGRRNWEPGRNQRP
jgi:hypothetical protein